MVFKNMLRERMDEVGMDIKELAKETGLSTGNIYSYLKGSIPSDDKLEKICEVLELNPNDISVDNSNLNMTVHEAATIMHKSDGYVKSAIINGTLPGSYVEGEKYSFHIPRLRFEEYMGQRKDIQAVQTMELLLQFIIDFITSKKSLPTYHSNSDQ